MMIFMQIVSPLHQAAVPDGQHWDLLDPIRAPADGHSRAN
jgi:hypothetical protein